MVCSFRPFRKRDSPSSSPGWSMQEVPYVDASVERLLGARYHALDLRSAFMYQGRGSSFRRPMAIGVLALVVVSWAGVTTGQTFAVASVKRSAPRGPAPVPGQLQGASQIRVQPGQVSVVNATLRDLVRRAYDVPEFLLVGGPAWVTRDRFDILATTDGQPSLPEARAMLRALLADSFRLRTHIETRSMEVMNLVLAREDRRLGTRLTQMQGTCAENRARLGRVGPPNADPDRPCTIRIANGRGMNTRTTWSGISMPQLARHLTATIQRPVVDQTGLSGFFDADIEFTLDGIIRESAPGPGQISIFDALQDQLGLKLVSARGTASTLVIDDASPPPQN